MATPPINLADADLLRAFVREGSESAFRSLTDRHVNLVFGTALRRTGHREAAQEITQNVFIALARKAAWLQVRRSLAGWLYRTTLLEARQWRRGETRRSQRELTAAELETTMKTTDARLSPLVEALDEGLVELSERERQVLLLRFLEGQKHREIGIQLGIGEDAARKRVDQALQHLTGYFRKRGFAVGPTAAVAVLEGAVHFAPAGLAATAAQAGLSQIVPGSVSLVGVGLAKLLGLRRAPIAGLCVAVLLVPTAWQGARLSSLKEAHRQMESLFASLQVRHEGLTRDQEEIERQLRRASNRLAQIEAESVVTRNLVEAYAPDLDPRLFLWNAEADYVRVPKSFMDWLSFAEKDTMASVGAMLDAERTFARDDGRLSSALLGALGLSAPEQQALQAHCLRHFEAYRAFATSSGYLAEIPSLNLELPATARINDASRAWVLPPNPEDGDRWRAAFEAGLAQLAGEERARIILRSARLDGSLSQHFQQFGAEDLMIVATPLPDGGVSLSRRRFYRGQPEWSTDYRVSFTTALSPSRTENSQGQGWQPADGLRRWLGRPLPAALVDYLSNWRDSHPEVPDEPPKQ